MNDNFNFLNLYKCDELKNLKGNDLKKFILELQKYYLSLRSYIGLDSDLTFGIEIEFENIVDIKKLNSAFKNADIIRNNWNITDDGSLDFGAEIVSPILKDDEEAWYDINSMCNLASNYGNIGRNAAGHVHIGTQTLGKNIENWYKFLKLWSAYENVIYRFSYNEYLNKLPGIHYCLPKANDFLRNCKKAKRKNIKNRDIFLQPISYSRTQSLNFQNVESLNGPLQETKKKDTIEFRCPNGTLDPVIWQNNVNLFSKILMYSKSPNYDEDIIDKRIQKKGELKYSCYNEIFLKESLEFADLIFDNNLDKVYFLRQYLKSYDVSLNDKNPTKTKRFTKSNF